MIKALINVRIFDYDNYYDNGFMIFDEQIIKVGNMSEYVKGDYQEIEGHRALIMPSFVCAHTHVYSIFARGMSLPFNPKTFKDILDQMWWKMDAKLDNEDSFYSGIAAAQEFLKNGVTTIIDHHASGQILGSLENLKQGLVDSVGIRALMCFETSDRFNVDECIKENLYGINTFKDKSSRGLFGLHASMSLSDETLRKVSESLNSAPIHIHVAESQEDEDDSLAKYGKTVVERLEEHKLLNPNSLIVHGVHISDKELEILSKKKDIYMVVNPTSNMNNAVGLPDVNKYLSYGLKVMVGNDGLSTSMANEYCNIYYATRLLNKSPMAFSLGDLKTLIDNGYSYASKTLGIKLGRLKPGYESDFMVVNYSPFTPMNKDNAFGHIFFGLFPSFNPKDVYVSGQCFVKNGKLLVSKVDREMLKMEEISNNLWNKIKGE